MKGIKIKITYMKYLLDATYFSFVMFLNVLFLSVASKFCGLHHSQIPLTSKSSGSGSNDTKSFQTNLTKLLEDTIEAFMDTYEFLLQLLAAVNTSLMFFTLLVFQALIFALNTNFSSNALSMSVTALTSQLDIAPNSLRAYIPSAGFNVKQALIAVVKLASVIAV